MSFHQEDDELPEAPLIRYYISSAELSEKRLAEAVRQHRFVENKLHWSLDVALCVHCGQAAETSPESERGDAFQGRYPTKAEESGAGCDLSGGHSCYVMVFMRFPWRLGRAIDHDQAGLMEMKK